MLRFFLYKVQNLDVELNCVFKYWPLDTLDVGSRNLTENEKKEKLRLI